MHLKADSDFNKLGIRTIKDLVNITRNCDSEDISDHVFQVFFDAKNRGEIERSSIYRLAFKFMADYYRLLKGEKYE